MSSPHYNQPSMFQKYEPVNSTKCVRTSSSESSQSSVKTSSSSKASLHSILNDTPSAHSSISCNSIQSNKTIYTPELDLDVENTVSPNSSFEPEALITSYDSKKHTNNIKIISKSTEIYSSFNISTSTPRPNHSNDKQISNSENHEVLTPSSSLTSLTSSPIGMECVTELLTIKSNEVTVPLPQVHKNISPQISVPQTNFDLFELDDPLIDSYRPTHPPQPISLDYQPDVPLLPSDRVYSPPSIESNFTYDYNLYTESYIHKTYPDRFLKPHIEDVLEIGVDNIMKYIEDIVYDKGTPLVIKNFHKLKDFPTKAFSLKNLQTQYSEPIKIYNQSIREVEEMEFKDFINESRSSSHGNINLYAKDLDAPREWQLVIQSLIPKQLHYQGDFDLMHYLPPDLASPNIEIYVGKGGTHTPFHIDICGAQGHNLIVNSEDEATSLWMMAGANDVHRARRFIDENSSEGQCCDLDNSLIDLDLLSKSDKIFYIFEQGLGDFVFVPSQSIHCVVNLGTGLTTKLSWNITTPKSLYHTLTHFSPLYRSIFKDEPYRNKAMAYHTLERWTRLLKSPRRINGTQHRNMILEHFNTIHSLVANMVAQEYIPTSHQYDNITIHQVKDKTPFKRACQFCFTDIFNTFLAPINEEKLRVSSVTPAICLDCVAEGRYMESNDELKVAFVYTHTNDQLIQLLNSSADTFNNYFIDNELKTKWIRYVTEGSLNSVYNNFNRIRLAFDRVQHRALYQDQPCSTCQVRSNGECISCSQPECTQISCYKCIDSTGQCFLKLNSSTFNCSDHSGLTPNANSPNDAKEQNYYLTTYNFKYKLDLDKNLYRDPKKISSNILSFYDQQHLVESDKISGHNPNPKKRVDEQDGVPKAKKPRVPKAPKEPKVKEAKPHAKSSRKSIKVSSTAIEQSNEECSTSDPPVIVKRGRGRPRSLKSNDTTDSTSSNNESTDTKQLSNQLNTDPTPVVHGVEFVSDIQSLSQDTVVLKLPQVDPQPPSESKIDISAIQSKMSDHDQVSGSITPPITNSSPQSLATSQKSKKPFKYLKGVSNPDHSIEKLEITHSDTDSDTSPSPMRPNSALPKSKHSRTRTPNRKARSGRPSKQLTTDSKIPLAVDYKFQRSNLSLADDTIFNEQDTQTGIDALKNYLSISSSDLSSMSDLSSSNI